MGMGGNSAGNGRGKKGTGEKIEGRLERPAEHESSAGCWGGMVSSTYSVRANVITGRAKNVKFRTRETEKSRKNEKKEEG